MLSPLKTFKQLHSYQRLLRPQSAATYHASLISESEYIDDAKRLHADVYVAQNFIAREELNASGHLSAATDPFQHHADYFAVIKQQSAGKPVVAVARQIYATSSTGYQDLPTLEKMELYADKRAELQSHDARLIVEISALAKQRGESPLATMVLYRAMWQHSLQTGHKYWVMACDKAVFRRLKFVFGDALLPIGPETFYMGSIVVPAYLNVSRSLQAAARYNNMKNLPRLFLNRNLWQFFTAGLSATTIESIRAQSNIKKGPQV